MTIEISRIQLYSNYDVIHRYISVNIANLFLIFDQFYRREIDFHRVILIYALSQRVFPVKQKALSSVLVHEVSALGSNF